MRFVGFDPSVDGAENVRKSHRAWRRDDIAFYVVATRTSLS
jgi:hypothetical protein